jgi:hypothetical protein
MFDDSPRNKMINFDNDERQWENEQLDKTEEDYQNRVSN